ncbi:SERPIN domain-containing protein [Aphelenchoides fujianensis]|nr:SERPIN domain-containing protein [Aphelenchoides fujianensis]
MILSPISIALALSLAYAGAGGDTRRKFERVFARGGMSGNALDSHFHRTLSELTAEHEDVTLELANRAYVDHQLEVKPAYKRLIAEHYGGHFEQVDFERPADVVEEINAFVANATHDKIHDIIDLKDINLRTRMQLINAIYFKAGDRKGLWARYVETGDVQVLELPYTDERANFVAFLPKERFGLADWLQEVDGAELIELMGRMKERNVEVSVC